GHGAVQVRRGRLQVLRRAAPAARRGAPRPRLSAARGDREPLGGRAGDGDALPARPPLAPGPLPPPGPDQADPAPAPLRGGGLQLPPRGPLRRRRLPPAAHRLPLPPGRRLHRRRVPAGRAAAARPVARRSRGDRAGRDRRLHDAPPTRARRARLLPRRDASRGEPRALRLALHARRHLPRRDVRSVSAPGSKKRRPTPRRHLQYLSRRVPDFPDWHQGQATISSRGPRSLTASREAPSAKVPHAPTLSVVIPVYNERGTIEELLWRVQQVGLEKEVIVVDDASTDGTRELLQQIADGIASGSESTVLPKTGRPLPIGNMAICLQPTNRGKGAALRRGFRLARGRIVIVQDADLEYNPQEYFRLIDPIERDLADVVYGSRFLGGPHRVLLYRHSLANTILTHLSNIFTDLNLTDVW